MKNSDMALVIIGYDPYKDVWNHYFKLLNKYWADNPFPVYLVNNEDPGIEYKGVTVINCGKDAEWSRKAQIAVQQVKEKYICLLLEDFLTRDYVDTEEVLKVVKFMKEKDMKYYKLTTFSKFRTPHYENYKFLYTIPKNMPYGISLQAAIWEKDFLKEKLGTDNYNAWTFEKDRLDEETNESGPLEGCVFDNRNILQIEHAIVQSVYLPPAIRYFNKIGYKIDLNERGMMNKRQYFIYANKRFWSDLLSGFDLSLLKKCLKKFGMTFVSDNNSR